MPIDDTVDDVPEETPDLSKTVASLDESPTYFCRKLTMEMKVINDHKWHMGIREQHAIDEDTATEDFAVFHAAYFDQQFGTNYSEIEQRCDQLCGKLTCRRSACPLENKEIHEMLHDGYTYEKTDE